MRDNRSKLHKVFDEIASDCVRKLVVASDGNHEVTPYLIGQVRQTVSKTIEQIYFGFHPKLPTETP